MPEHQVIIIHPNGKREHFTCGTLVLGMSSETRSSGEATKWSFGCSHTPGHEALRLALQAAMEGYLRTMRVVPEDDVSLVVARAMALMTEQRQEAE